MTHTKGKWEVFTGAHLTYIVCKNTSIAIMCTDNKKSSDACKDNARLISAAPDLLEALKGMLDWARRVKEQNPGMEVLNACTAIKKAEVK